jgi:hypothetical protein
MPHLDHTPQGPLNVSPAGATDTPIITSWLGCNTRLHHELSMHVGSNLVGLGLPSPLNPVLIQTSNCR